MRRIPSSFGWSLKKNVDFKMIFSIPLILLCQKLINCLPKVICEYIWSHDFQLMKNCGWHRVGISSAQRKVTFVT
jgi:hypothetical protein